MIQKTVIVSSGIKQHSDFTEVAYKVDHSRVKAIVQEMISIEGITFNRAERFRNAKGPRVYLYFTKA